MIFEATHGQYPYPFRIFDAGHLPRHRPFFKIDLPFPPDTMYTKRKKTPIHNIPYDYMTNYQTQQHSYNDDELISALQKSIRRGEETDALYFALELANESKSGMGVLYNRLKVIAYEDIGIGDPDAVLQACKALDDMKEMYKKQTGEWSMVLSHIILLLCRAQKSRISCNLLTTIHAEWEDTTHTRDIPDYALDMHTTQGRLLGRTRSTKSGIDHFINEGGVIHDENPDIDDIYKEHAQTLLRKKPKKEHSIKIKETQKTLEVR